MIGVRYWVKSQSFKKEDSGAPWFTVRWVTFNPRKFTLNADDVKDIMRKKMKKSKDTLNNEYDVIYARASKAGRGANVRTDYSICVKPFANTIFVIPKSHRKEARKAISELSIKGNFTL